jgi:predicted dehydrogenase
VTGDRYRAVLVGCGPRGSAHAEAYRHVRSASLVACCDLDRGRLESVATAKDIPLRFSSVAEMMQAVQPDLVQIATPPTGRRRLVRQVLEHRPRAILLEKPLALRPEEGYGIVDDCRASGVCLFVNHQLRFFAPLERFRAVLRGGVLGTVRLVRATSAWSLLGQGTHLFDLVSYLFDDELEFDRVAAQTIGAASGEDGVLDTPGYACGVVRCSGGIHLYYECGPGAPSWPGHHQQPWHQLGIELVGTRGVAGLSLNRGWWCHSATLVDQEWYVHEDEDDPAQARLVDSLLASLDRPDEHPNGPRRSLLSFGLVMAVQRASLHRAWTDPGERGEDEEIERLRALDAAVPVRAGEAGPG